MRRLHRTHWSRSRRSGQGYEVVVAEARQDEERCRNLTGVGDEMLSARVGGSPYLPWLQPGDVRVQVECDRDVGAAEALLYDLRGDSGFQRE
jgi:hypothetical protein